MSFGGRPEVLRVPAHRILAAIACLAALGTGASAAYTVRSGDTLSGLIDDLDAKHSGFKGRLITPEGGLHRFVNIYIGEEDIRFLDGLKTELKAGDAISIVPAIAGGRAT